MVWGAGFAPPKETSGTESVCFSLSHVQNNVNKSGKFRERVWFGALASLLLKKLVEQNQ